LFTTDVNTLFSFYGDIYNTKPALPAENEGNQYLFLYFFGY